VEGQPHVISAVCSAINVAVVEGRRSAVRRSEATLIWLDRGQVSPTRPVQTSKLGMRSGPATRPRGRCHPARMLIGAGVSSSSVNVPEATR
jgi:hypothetical protein